MGARFNIKSWKKRNENQKHASELVSLQFLWQAKKEINDGDFTSGCRQLEVFLITREDIYLFVSSK